jgi:signal transduction histidine kinase
MSGLVDELLTLAKLEEGRLELARSNVDGAELVAAAAREGELLARGQGLSIQVEQAEHVTLRCDAVRVGQVLRILVDNAVQHTPAGGNIAIGVQRAGDTAEFWVQDTGAGIAPEHLEHIFERFYRADSPRTRGTGGSGLGLSIASRIVEAHGGEIEAVSRPDVDGTRFSFTLPA